MRPLAMVAAILVTLSTCGTARSANAGGNDPAAALISRARVALGPGLGHVKSLHLTGTFSAGDVHGTTESWIDLLDGRFATLTDAGPLTEGDGCDGRSAWRSDAKGIVLPQTGPLAKAIAANEIFDNSYALFRPHYGGADVSYLGTRTDAGKNYEAISVKPKGAYGEEIWFDSATALPARTIADYRAGTITTNLSGYRSVAGLMVPTRQVITERMNIRDFYGHKQADASHDVTCNYTSAESGISSADSHFVMPTSAIRDVSMPASEIRIPFTMRNFWILISVRLNGKGPFQLMLDSGGRNTISPAVAWEIGATEAGQVPQSSNLPSVKPLRFARVASVEIGGAKLAQQYFVVGHIGNEFTPYGMIGYDLFERFITTIDYANRQIILRAPGRDPNAAISPEGEVSLPLEFDDTKPETACKVADTDATCIADTGAAVALILSGPFTKANSTVQPPWFAGAYAQVYSSGGPSEVRFGPISSFQIGPFALANVDTLFTTMGNGALALYPSALVGNRVWRQFTVTYDYSHAALRLTPNASLGQR